MRITVNGKGMKVSDRLHEHVEKKLSKFDRYFDESAEALVKFRPEGDDKCAEVTIKFRNQILRAETVAGDVYTALDQTQEVLEGQLRRHKTRMEKHIRDYAQLEQIRKTEPQPGDLPEDIPSDEESTASIVRRKTFELTPMSEEEACLQMELLGHNFHIFLAAKTGQVALVYKRRDGNYGLIEPTY